MLLLALDTATEKGSLALAEDDLLLGEYFLHSPGTYLQHLLPGIEELFHAAGRSLRELGAIAVSQGPGNFTGLRIGLATAKTLAWSLGCPLAAVPTMEALAANFPFHPHPIGVIVDAKRQEVFWGLYQCDCPWPAPLMAPRRLPAADLTGLLTPPLLLTGPGLKAHEEMLQSFAPPGVSWAPPEMRHPRAASVARLGRRLIEEGRAASPADLTPTYLRPAL